MRILAHALSIATLLAALLSFGCATSFGVNESSAVPTRAVGASYPSWEYICFVVNRGNFSSRLNDAGAEGWELVSVDAQGLACFKRPVETYVRAEATVDSQTGGQ